MTRFSLSLLLACVLPLAVRADVKLPAIYGDHMVLQRDKPILVRGTAEADEEVTVSFAGAKTTTKASADGTWKATLPAQKANATGQTLTVAGKNTVEFKDVLVGEVWVGSGQSNMEWSLAQSHKAKEFIAGAKHANIRLFHVKKTQSKTAKNDVEVTAPWKECTPETARQFSAVLYHFGAKLHKELDVPIGLINSSWGGSAIEPWTITTKGSGGMYNAMISGLLPFQVRGVVWYQGESNVSNGLAYREKMKNLIEGWRRVWDNKDMPFYFVQIAPWTGYKPDLLPLLWEAQTATLHIPNTGMAATTDLVDNLKDIHPGNKKDVGLRLALWALSRTYQQKGLVVSGPLYKSMAVEDGKIRLRFAHVGGGLTSRDGKDLTNFEIAGEDGKFAKAMATIEKDTVVVSSSEVAKPTQVRFGWNNLANPNLTNKEGLPAAPFRTEKWQGGTAEDRSAEPSPERSR